MLDQLRGSLHRVQMIRNISLTLHQRARCSRKPDIPNTMKNTQLADAVLMSPQYVWWLSILATTGLCFMWTVFWIAVWRRKENITNILTKPEFFKVVTVMGVIAGTVVLSLADRIKGELTAAILSGIVGYVLGAVANKTPGASRQRGHEDKVV